MKSLTLYYLVISLTFIEFFNIFNPLILGAIYIVSFIYTLFKAFNEIHKYLTRNNKNDAL